MFGSGTAALAISNDETNDTTRTVKSLEESGLLIKGVNEIIQNEAKEQKGRSNAMLLDTLAASLMESASADKVVIRAGEGVIRGDEGTIKAGQDF